MTRNRNRLLASGGAAGRPVSSVVEEAARKLLGEPKGAAEDNYAKWRVCMGAVWMAPVGGGGEGVGGEGEGGEGSGEWKVRCPPSPRPSPHTAALDNGSVHVSVLVCVCVCVCVFRLFRHIALAM